ncbi:Carboxysome shell protein CsoS2 [hydrothermal vent metagenome]|uniref:Carboxysome shell protein CsoS2 n=1 Tax=hydrothermal vent metagenome TaxID=652676 RepID=A0A3B1A9E4_9ZZZZ
MQKLSGRAASMARREAQVSGKNVSSARSNTSAPAVSSTPPVAAAVARRPATVTSTGRAASQARRLAMSKQGKSGVASTDRQRMADTMRSARNQAQQKKDCGCGCNGEGDCAKNVPSTSASALSRVSPKSGSRRRSQEPKKVTPSNAGRINSRLRREMLAKHGKSGHDVFRKGLSSAQMVKHQNPDISGRQLARSIRAQRSATGAQGAAAPAPVGRKRPRPETGVTGTKVAHSEKTTGDEIGLCRSVTGTDYMSSEVFTDFCQADSPKVLPSVPAKVQTTETLSGSTVTGGGKVGRSERVTGDERGSCRNVTGNEYVGREQYDNFCQSKPEPGSAKVSHSQTTRGLIVSGSKPARSRSVTGDELGTCKAVTGTPYAGVEQTLDYCMPQEVKAIQARTSLPMKSNTGRDISGVQPGLSGLTGTEKGSCQSVSGTAYLGDSEQINVCGTTPAQVGDSDFPQPLEGAPWGTFSIATPNHASEALVHASEAPVVASGVTGTSYEQGRVSGTFSLGEGKVTGTEQFRSSGRRNESPVAVPKAPVEKAKEAKVSRVTGEGLSTGLTVTGNDWDRGEHVTGTEGRSATRRNVTIRGPMNAMPGVAPKRNEEVPPSDSKVTGGSGNTEKGAMITVSGGARG